MSFPKVSDWSSLGVGVELSNLFLAISSNSSFSDFLLELAFLGTAMLDCPALGSSSAVSASGLGLSSVDGVGVGVGVGVDVVAISYSSSRPSTESATDR